MGIGSSPNLVTSRNSHKAGRLTISWQARLHDASRARSLAYKGTTTIMGLQGVNSGLSTTPYVKKLLTDGLQHVLR